MSIGGSKGSVEDKRRAGRAGWQAMIRAQTIFPDHEGRGVTKERK